MRLRVFSWYPTTRRFQTITESSDFLSYTLIQTYVSVNSKPDHPPGRPPRIRTLSLPQGSGFRPIFFPGGRRFELEKFPTVLKEKCRNFSICFVHPFSCPTALFSSTSMFQSNVYCIFNNRDHFRPVRSF